MNLGDILSHVKRIEGVGAYIFLDGKGTIISHNGDIQAPEKLSKMIYTCGRHLSSVGKKYFKYASFSRARNKDILIFPVGNYYLGVVKESGSKDFETADAVMKFLNVLAGKRD